MLFGTEFCMIVFPGKLLFSAYQKILVSYLFLFHRQLPLLLSLMKGKDRLTASNFKWTNQLTLCNHVFDLFDLLRPHVFTMNKVSIVLCLHSNPMLSSYFFFVFYRIFRIFTVVPSWCSFVSREFQNNESSREITSAF